MDIWTIVAALGLGALALILVVVLRLASSLKTRDGGEALVLEAKLRDLTAAHSDLAGRLAQLTQSNAQGQSDIQKTLSDSLKLQAEKTAETLGGLQARLKTIDEAQKNLTDLSGQVVGLQQILSNKQTRGAYGQGHMESIIRDALPQGSYQFQAQLSNDKRPDCIIHLPGSKTAIVIDSKFPLECFEMLRASAGDADRKAAGARIRLDVLKHVRDIAEKYLIAGETQDPAIMFVPSEWIYAELYESYSDLIQQAHRLRVIVVSPNILLLAINTVKSLLKDSRMREQAALIQKEVGELMLDVVRLDDRVRKLQTHFGQAEDDMRQILISSEKVAKRAERIEKVEVGAPEPLPVAPPV